MLKEADYDRKDSIALLFFHASIVDGNKLVLRPAADYWYYDFSEEYDEIARNGNIPEDIRNYMKNHSGKRPYNGYCSDVFLMENNYLEEQKVEITFTHKFKDSKGETAAIPWTYYWYRGSYELNDVYSPVILDAWALFQESAELEFAGGYKYDFTKFYHNSGYKESKYLFLPETALSNIPKMVQVVHEHVRNRFDLYVKAIDNNDTLETDFGVSKLHYSIKRIGKPDGTAVSPYDGIYENTIDYKKNSITLDSDVLQKGNDNYLKLENIHEEKDGMWINIDVSGNKYPEGLYYMELYAEDLSGNSGKINPLTGTEYSFVEKESFASKENAEYSKHVMQFYFYKDTSAPVVNSTLYTSNSDALMPKPVFTAETVLPKDSSGKIKDAEIEKYNRDAYVFYPTVFRYCEIKSSSTRSTNKWTKNPSSLKYEDWKKTSVDYKFDYDSIHETLPDGYCDIWISHCDSVGNISEPVILQNALYCDKTAPKVIKERNLVDDDGTAYGIIFTEKVSGLKKIHYSVTDSKGNDYPDVKCETTDNSGIYYNGYYKRNVDFVIDTEKHEITFTNPIVDDTSNNWLYVNVADLPDSAEGVVAKFKLEDAAGNLSEEIAVQL